MARVYDFTQPAAYAIVWVLFFVATLFLTARIWIRVRMFGKLLLDDYMAIFGIINLLAGDIIMCWLFPLGPQIDPVTIYGAPPPPNWEALITKYNKLDWAVACFFYTGLWTSKGIFLVFYGKLTEGLKVYRVLWWILVALTISTYVGAMFVYAFLEGVHAGRLNKGFQTHSILYVFVTDLATDIGIAALPLFLALRTAVPWRKKLGLAAIFSLGLITTAFSLIRYLVAGPVNHNVFGASWLLVWSMIHQCVGFIVACAISFRTFVVDRQYRGRESPEEPDLDTSNVGGMRSPLGTITTAVKGTISRNSDPLYGKSPDGQDSTESSQDYLELLRSAHSPSATSTEAPVSVEHISRFTPTPPASAGTLGQHPLPPFTLATTPPPLPTPTTPNIEAAKSLGQLPLPPAPPTRPRTYSNFSHRDRKSFDSTRSGPRLSLDRSSTPPPPLPRSSHGEKT